MKSAMRLSPKKLRFVEEYLVDLNATQAAARAGYSAKTAYSQGQRLLKDVEVQAGLSEAQARRSERTEITADRVLQELGKIGFANMLDYMRVGPDGDPVLDFSALTRDQAAALQEVTVEDFLDGRGEDARQVRRVKFKLVDKLGTLSKIGQHLGMFVERRELTGKDGGPISTARADLTSLTDDQLWSLLLDEIPEMKAQAEQLAKNQTQNERVA